MFSHISQEVDGKSHKEINSFISLIIWVLQALGKLRIEKSKKSSKTFFLNYRNNSPTSIYYHTNRPNHFHYYFESNLHEFSNHYYYHTHRSNHFHYYFESNLHAL
jgi:hypothetical protein